MSKPDERKVRLRALKQFALERLPKDFVLRDVLISEHDEMNSIEFLAKLDLWLKLLRRDLPDAG